MPNLLRLATAASQSQNYQEAYGYYTRALELDSLNSAAWAGKAEAAGRLSNQQTFRFQEMINYFSRSIEVAESRNRAEESAGNTSSQVITQYYNRMRSSLAPAFAEGESWMLYLNGLNNILSAIDKASNLMPRSVSLLQTGIYICGDNTGYLPYFNRNTKQAARRPLPPELAALVMDRKRVYTDRLYIVAPHVTPVSIENSYHPGLLGPMTPAKWVLYSGAFPARHDLFCSGEIRRDSTAELERLGNVMQNVGTADGAAPGARPQKATSTMSHANHAG